MANRDLRARIREIQQQKNDAVSERDAAVRGEVREKNRAVSAERRAVSAERRAEKLAQYISSSGMGMYILNIVYTWSQSLVTVTTTPVQGPIQYHQSTWATHASLLSKLNNVNTIV